MSSNWTPEDLAVVNMRIAANLKKQYPQALKEDETEADPGPESELQKKIVADAKINGWPVLSLRQSRKAEGFIVPGWPDITLCLPLGRVVFMELKGKGGVLKDKQRLMLAMLKILGYETYIVKSFKRYLEIKGGNDGKQRA